jgi:hypothetical protein
VGPDFILVTLLLCLKYGSSLHYCDLRKFTILDNTLDHGVSISITPPSIIYAVLAQTKITIIATATIVVLVGTLDEGLGTCQSTL